MRVQSLFGLLTASHEPISTGLTKVALSAGQQSNRSVVCRDHLKQITANVCQHKHTFACSNLLEISSLVKLKH